MYAISTILRFPKDDERIVVLGMDPQFEELAGRITRDVSTAVTRDVTAAVTRDVTAAVTRDVSATVTLEVTAAVTRDVTATVTKDVTTVVTQNIAAQLAAAEARLSSQAQAHMEEVRSHAKAAAENYGAILDGINRRLDRIEKKVTANHRETSAILKNHNERITALESTPPQTA